MPRMSAAAAPYPESVQTQLDAIMPKGVPPLWLFRVLARDERLFGRFFNAGLLDRGHLTLHERELVILRVCANNRSEYEWGVHVTFFAERAKLSADQVRATVNPAVELACWDDRERLLLRMCDELLSGTRISDALYRALSSIYSEGARLELLMLASTYRTVSVLTNSLDMPLEEFAARFPV